MAYLSMGEAHRRISSYLASFSDAIAAQDGGALKPLLAVSSSSSSSPCPLLGVADALVAFHDWPRLVNQSERFSNIGETLIPLLRSLQSYRLRRFADAYASYERAAK